MGTLPDHAMFLQKLHELRQAYAQRLPEKIAHIQGLWHALEQTWDDNTIRIMHCEVHGIAGSGATYGFERVGVRARRLEQLLQFLIEHAAIPTHEERAQIGKLLDAVVSAYRHEITADPPPLPAQPPPSRPVPHTESSHTQPTQRQQITYETNRIVFLVEDDLFQAHDLQLQINHFGYHVVRFERIEQAIESLRKTRPAAILMDIVFPESNLAGIEAIQALQKAIFDPVPVIFMSYRNDIIARLNAVRVGGHAYFPKPVDISTLIDKLDTLTTQIEPEPHRIMIVDDDAILATYHATILQQEEILTRVVTNPLDILDPLMEFKPDLILMDIYMPGCTGLELASVIRQQGIYVGTPIVFLSGETDMHKHWDAMRRGGDDFLTKPIDPEHLIAMVTSRVHRSRELRASMIHDSLTGLLNHTATKEYLEREVALALRRDSPLSFAMLDLDHFKTVNDTYGHPIGDRVLKNLARVLRQRLRKTDIIGRYGGEEFAVMMPDTPAPLAHTVLDEIREGFSQIKQSIGVCEFSVTFSCGIASVPPYDDPNWVNKAADSALYQAKHRGRNQVVLAPPPDPLPPT